MDTTTAPVPRDTARTVAAPWAVARPHRHRDRPLLLDLPLGIVSFVAVVVLVSLGVGLLIDRRAPRPP